MGGTKRLIKMAIQYANERQQFDHPISSYGAIQYKLAEAAIRIFALESTVYRVADLMEDRKIAAIDSGKDAANAMLIAAEEYAVECAIIKISGSEIIDYVVDELIQIHGGYGYSEEYAPARIYRDTRINRIYEGTNEINRMLIINMILRRTLKGQLDLVGPAWEVQKELTSLPSSHLTDEPYALEIKSIKDFRKMVLMVAGAAVKYQMDGKHDLKTEQEILMNVADMIIDLYLAESILLRIQKLKENYSQKLTDLHESAMKVFFWDAQSRLVKNGQDALASFAAGDELRIMLLGIKRFSRYEPVNVKQHRRNIAAALIANESYCF